MASSGSDRRGFPRLKANLSVRYKFLSSSVKDPAMERVCIGSTRNLSLGGLQLVGAIPNLDWLKHLLVGRMNVGVNFQLELDPEPVKALCRLAWVEAGEEGAIAVSMGLRIVDMPPDHRARLSTYLIKNTALPA